MNEKISLRQERLSKLLRVAPSVIRVSDVMSELDLDREHAAKLLAGWHKQGVIRRITTGLYVPIQPNSIGQTQILENPWILVPEIYEPGYIGGWSALEYWELTEQLFRTVCVLTSKRTSYGETTYQGVNFFVKHIADKQLFGTKTIWHNNVKMQISDVHKTILDIISDPSLGAGLQHTVDCLLEYKKTYDNTRGTDQLLKYAIQVDNGALFKKLGYLAEKLNFNKAFVKECGKHLTKGYTYLDKRAQDNRLITRWGLWVPNGYDL